MKILLLLLSFCLPFLVHANNENSTNLAIKWLQIIDNENYQKSWQKADDFFKAQIEEKEWHAVLKRVRTPLGKVISRTQQSSKRHNSLPGISDGEYIIIQFQTEFTHKKNATEILTLSKNSGQWRAIGYFIK